MNKYTKVILMNKYTKIILMTLGIYLLMFLCISPVGNSLDAELLFPPYGSYNSSSSYKSSKCIECHFSDNHPDAPKLSENRGHHPLGKTWANTSCAGCHQSPPYKIRTALVLDGFKEDGTPLPSDVLWLAAGRGIPDTN